MSLLDRLKRLLWGANGYDPEEHETEVRRIKDESFGAMDATGINFAEIGRRFEAPIEGEDPMEDKRECRDHDRP
jgi:hypothetical protein